MTFFGIVWAGWPDYPGMNKTSLFALALAAGCYGSAHPHPKTIPLPDLSKDGTIAVDSESTTNDEDVDKTSETCPQGETSGGPDCIVTHYTEREPVTRTQTTATYDGAPISLAQLEVMTDPDRDKKIEHLDALRKTCSRAGKARWVGIGLLAAGVVTYAIGGAADSKPAVIASGVTIAGGLGAFGVGYFKYGGRACNEARDLYRDLDVSADVDTTTAWGPDYAAKMKELADRFNASRAATAAR